MTPAFFGSIGATEIIIVLLIAVVIFGRRLPEVGRTIGKTLFQVRKGINEIKGDFYEQTADIRDEVKSTERDLNRMLSEPPKPVSEKTEKPEPEAEETDGEPAESPDIDAEKAADEEEKGKRGRGEERKRGKGEERKKGKEEKGKRGRGEKRKSGKGEKRKKGKEDKRIIKKLKNRGTEKPNH